MRCKPLRKFLCHTSILLLLAFGVLLAPANEVLASDVATQSASLDESTATLLSSQSSLAPNQDVLVGIKIALAPHWHTYTYNPGDSGIPSTIKWNLPKGFKVSDVYWPPHESFDEAGLTTYGFSDEVVFTSIITTPGDLFLDTNTSIHATAEYLVCKDICIPQTAAIVLDLPKGDGAPSADAGLLETWHHKSALAPADGIIGEPTTDSPSSTPEAEKKTNDAAIQTRNVGIIAAIFFALLGGLILNLMPCVFPVLSLKALAIAKHSELDHATVRKEGLAYTFGVLSCFWTLAIILIVLQQTGASFGWGFQFQSPAFVGLMSLLLLFIGLNLSGIFELPVLFGNVANELEKPDSIKGSYFTGLLAALVATPCTAPFMATAVGAALSNTPLFALTVFSALGLGLALPFLLLSFVPALLKWLPKPGVWMLTFKSFLAFPMYLSAIWLLWVVGTQTGISGMTAVLTVGVIVLFLLWAKRPCKFESRYCLAANFFVILALLAIMAQGLNRLQQMHDQPTRMSTSDAVEPYSAARLQELRDAETPVFVDATASWCITCQINKKLAIETTSVQKAFNDAGMVTLIADWTNKDDEVTNFLTSFGYKGVPLYVYYAPNAEGVVLPQILTPSILIDSIKE